MGAGYSSSSRTRRERAAAQDAMYTQNMPYPSAGPNPHYPWPQGQQTMQYRTPASNGQYYVGNMPYPQYQQQQRTMPPPVPEQTQRTSTIRNDVNLKKSSLRVTRDPSNPDVLLVSFSFDASAPCAVSVFFDVEELVRDSCRLAVGPSVLPPSARTTFDKGLSQKFIVAAPDGLLRSSVPSAVLFKPEAGRFPLVVRLETIKRAMPGAGAELPLPPGCALPPWVQAQTTYATLTEGHGGDVDTRVLKQKIWVEGVSYELQEIYGIEQVAVGATSTAADESAKECVICMSEARDTTVLPCRHMCMCATCARMLRHQTNRCPICRTTVEGLLEIKVESRQAACATP